MSERIDLDQDGEGTEATPSPPPKSPLRDDDRPSDPDEEEVLEVIAEVPADEQEVPLGDEHP
jgi:hypothetical protein